MKRPTTTTPTPAASSDSSEKLASATAAAPNKPPTGSVVKNEHVLPSLRGNDFEARVAAIKKSLEGWGPGLGQNLDPGDKVTFTVGAETFTPVPYFSFTVGPFAATVSLRKDEGVEDMVMRVYKFLIGMFEIEFDMKNYQNAQRIGEAGKYKKVS